MPNGFWAHGNFVENVGPWGIRYGYSSRFTDGDGQDGSVDSSVTALVENNVVHIAGFQPNHLAGALSMHDAQNRTFHDNSLNANDGPGMQFAWNLNRSDRTNLYNSLAEGNSLSGEAIRGSGMTDDKANPGGVLVARRNNAP
jgi:hypothetical protein